MKSKLFQSFAWWVNDRRWAANVRRARAFRRELTFSQRIKFDNALRHSLGDGTCIAYPGAFYHVEIGDLLNAITACYAYSQGEPVVSISAEIAGKK